MSETSESVRVGREYPRAPVVGVAAVVVNTDKILLIRRGREPMLGAWSLPGGALELGETTAEGVAREVLEETGLHVKPTKIVGTVDRIFRDDADRVQFHYVLIDWLCVLDGGPAELVCGDDAVEARWISRDELGTQEYDLGASTLDIIDRALRMMETEEK